MPKKLAARSKSGFFRMFRKPVISMEASRSFGEIIIERARVLHVEDGILVFEFEAPADGFILPDDDVKIRVVFDDGEETCFARVLKHDSSKPGPHPAGLTVRMALKLEGHGSWHHETAEIHWSCRLKSTGVKTDVEVSVHIQLENDL